jgi:hypothetical protein
MGDNDRKIIAALAKQLGPYPVQAAVTGRRLRADTLPDGSSDWQLLREAINRDPTAEDYQLLIDERTLLRGE